MDLFKHNFDLDAEFDEIFVEESDSVMHNFEHRCEGRTEMILCE